MASTATRIFETSQKVSQYFADLPADRIDQCTGSYYENSPCCVGAHVAHCLENARSFIDGAEAFARQIGGRTAHVVLMLRAVGVKDPLGTEDWEVPPEVAFDRLSRIEELPELRWADFSESCLTRVDFRGLDLTGAKFRDCDMDDAYMDAVKAPNADFTGANMPRVTAKKGDFACAKFCDVIAEEAVFTDADMRSTDWRGANTTTTDADFNGTDLRGAAFPEKGDHKSEMYSDAILFDEDLELSEEELAAERERIFSHG